MQRIVESVFRIFGGLILLFFAFAPAWILFDLVKTLIFDPGDLDLVAAAAFLICAPLLYFFLLLAYRAITGRGRKQDGGLLPRWALKVFAVVFGAVAVAIAAFGLLQEEYGAFIGGLGYFGSALVLYKVVRIRERADELPDE